jgi:hypothetical protein
MIKVALEVVGIYFDQNVIVKPNASVLDLMIAAKEQDPNFDFGIKKGSKSMDFISYNHPVDFKGPVTPTIRAAGLYKISDERPGNPTIVWQSYMVRDGVTLSRNRAIVFSADTAKDYPLQNGDRVIWRALAIQREPTEKKKKS